MFVPAGQAAALSPEFAERGLDKSGIRLFGGGDITDDDILNEMGDVGPRHRDGLSLFGGASVGENRAFVDGVRKANAASAPTSSVSAAMTACTSCSAR